MWKSSSWVASVVMVLMITACSASAMSIVGKYAGIFTSSNYPAGGAFALNITSQTQDVGGFDVIEGYSDIVCAVPQDCHGRLMWTGELYENGRLTFLDFDLRRNEYGSPIGLGRAEYTGIVSDSVISGDWRFPSTFSGVGTFNVTAVPEPGSLPLMTLGFILLGAGSRSLHREVGPTEAAPHKE